MNTNISTRTKPSFWHAYRDLLKHPLYLGQF